MKNGISKIYAATSIENVLEIIDNESESQSIIRLDLYDNRHNHYKIEDINYCGT
jgi:hypothetical protein